MSSTHPFVLETLIDFPDDALDAGHVVTAAHVEAMMAGLAKVGVRRVSWDSYGDGHGGFFLPTGIADSWSRYGATLDALDNPLKTAVEMGHRHGIEVYGYYKPYETGPAMYFPEGSPEARAHGRLWKLGGYLTWLDPFVVKHPELRIKRRDDALNGQGQPICAIRLTKKDDSPTRVTAQHLQLWTSNLNYRYERFDGAFKVTETIELAPRDVYDMDEHLLTPAGAPVRVLTFSGFELRDRYVMVTTDFQEGPADFENTGVHIMAALDAAGHEITGVFATGAAIWEGNKADFRTWGLMFDDGWARMPICLDDPNNTSPGPVGYGLGHRGVIAFTAGRNAYLPAALCETEPAVQAHWLQCVQEMIDAGVDGVDFRVEGHSTHTDYPDEYGYNDIVMEQAAARRPKDPLGAVPEVRGEAYTEFLRKARALLREHGGAMRINLNVDYFRPDPPGPELPAYPRNIDFNWKQWVEMGLLDQAIMRFFHSPFEWLFDDSVARDMIATCERHGVSVVVNRYMVDASGLVQSNTDREAEFRGIHQDGRFDGFILYESASIGGWDKQGNWSLTSDQARRVCRAFAETSR
jgi:hypothetical protein